MLNICKTYALEHNLRFSTDADPVKCKTKCLAFLSKDRPIRQVQLSGNPLPWVSNGKHLGNFIENKVNSGKMDMKVKRVSYIDN
jgi:hypothetical protein